MRRRRPVVLVLVAGILLGAGGAEAGTLEVPAVFPTIRAAVEAAAPGDEIRVGPGRHCGATLDKRVTLVGRGARVVACSAGPRLFDGLAVGFHLSDTDGTNAASATRISGFTFEGAGTAGLAFGVFARFADDVEVVGNVFDATVQAITNTAGDRWTITDNRILALRALACDDRCGGGIGIAIQTASGDVALPGGSLNPRNRPEGNTVAHNEIEGRPPERLDAFSIAGILVLAADRTVVTANRLALAPAEVGEAAAAGVVVASVAGSDETPAVPGARDTTVLENDGDASEYAVLVQQQGAQSTGLTIERNRGTVVVEPGSSRRP